MVKKEKKFILYCLTKTTGRELTRPKRVGEYNHPFGAENQARVKLEYHRRMEFKILDCWTRKTWKINHLFKPNFPLQIYNEPWE
jgi:site-specific DNA-adenine methylase